MSHRQRTIGGSRYVMLSIGYFAFSITAHVFAADTNPVKSVSRASEAVQTDFVKDAKLSTAEVRQVVNLALKCGMPDVERVGTFNFLPGGGWGITATSKERVNGREISYDSVFVRRVGWEDATPEANAKRLGPFWVDAPYVETTLLREFAISNKTVRIAIGKDIDTQFADKVVRLMLMGKTRFKDDWSRRDFHDLDLSKLTSISKRSFGDGYELRYDQPRMGAILFKLEKGEIVVTGIATIDI